MLVEKNSPHGGDIYSYPVAYDFSANVSPLGTPEEVKKAICQASEQVTSYPDPYCRELKQAVADYEKVSENSLIFGNGAADLIFSFVLALHPKKALIVAPTFSEYQGALRLTKTEVKYLFLREEDGFLLREDDILSACRDCDVVFLCNPNNPTGRSVEKGLLQKLCAQCLLQKTYLFVDECFCSLTDFPESLSLKGEAKKNPYLFLLKAFTKSHGMAGVRLGYGISGNFDLLCRMGMSSSPWNVSTLAQKAGIAAVNCQDFLEENRRIIHTQREFLYEGLQKLGVTVYPSEVNFLLFRQEEGFFERMLRQGVLVRSCGNFPGLDSSFYRCAVKKREDNLAFLHAVKNSI